MSQSDVVNRPLNPAPASHRLAIRGDLLDFADDPGSHSSAGSSVRYIPNGWLLIQDGRIVQAETAGFEPGNNWQIVDYAGHLICPGFIDTHVHSGQLDVIASFGTTLLQWLDQYTFPNERRFSDTRFAHDEAQVFCDALLANGTTTAMVFPTVHTESVNGLFEAAMRRQMCLIAGKVLMNRHCPNDLRDPADAGQAESRRLIERWHQHSRLHYAVTPRFAPTSTEAQLTMAGHLIQEYENLFVQTHVAENTEEVQWVTDLFPDDRSYLAVYDRHGLLTPRTLLAHGIYLNNQDRQLMSQRGSGIAFCPSSNLFLGSGLLDVQACHDHGVSVTLASDVGGGTHLNMLRVMADASRVMALTGQKLTAFQAFYQATLGAATALRLEHEIGSFRPGAWADLVVLRWHNDALQQRRGTDRSLHSRLFALMMLGDIGNIAATWVAGKCQHEAALTPAGD